MYNQSSLRCVSRCVCPVQAFEFGVPPGCDLVFIPNVGEIPARSNLRVQVEFSPRPDPEVAATAEAAAVSEVPAGGKAGQDLPQVLEVGDGDWGGCSAQCIPPQRPSGSVERPQPRSGGQGRRVDEEGVAGHHKI